MSFFGSFFGALTDYPAESDVRAGITYGTHTGTLLLPAVSDVRDGTYYGGGGTEFLGTYGAIVSSGSGGGDLSGAIEAAITTKNIRKATNDEGSFETHSLKDMTEAKHALNSDQALAAGPAKIMRQFAAQIKPPGTVDDA